MDTPSILWREISPGTFLGVLGVLRLEVRCVSLALKRYRLYINGHPVKMDSWLSLEQAKSRCADLAWQKILRENLSMCAPMVES